MVNSFVRENRKGVSSGASARSFLSRNWGFASSPSQDSANLDVLVNRATENAELLGKYTAGEFFRLPAYPGNAVHGFPCVDQKFSVEEVIQFLSHIDSEVLKRFTKLNSRTFLFSDIGEETHLVTSDGSVRDTLHKRSILYVSLTSGKNGENFQLSRKFSIPSIIHEYMGAPEKLMSELSDLYENLVKKADGVSAKAGVRECILDPGLTGIFAHEAVGHTVEADFVMAGSIAGNLMNKQVASPLISLVDFASECMGEPCPVQILMDEEGITGEDAVIIENGILRSYLHNRESAELYGVVPSGNGRAQYYHQEPLIRMRNTAILPGKDKLEDMISSVKNGYYLLDYSNGQADSTGEFMFTVTEGYEVVNGKLGKAIHDTTVSGLAFDVLKSVTAVSDTMKWSIAGCGKKYGIPVGMGGPAVKCTLKVGG